MKKSGKSHVSEEVRKDYQGGGEKREWLEIALLEAIKEHGTDRKHYNKVKERFYWKGWGYLVRQQKNIYIFFLIWSPVYNSHISEIYMIKFYALIISVNISI